MASLPEICHFASLRGFVADDSAGSGGTGKSLVLQIHMPIGDSDGRLSAGSSNPAIRAGMGGLFLWKVGILIVVALLSILVYRPFCRYLCPLGAVYGLFNPISLYRFRIDEARCTKCGICQKTCKLDIPVYQKPNSVECIRCGDCKKACPHGAIYTINKKSETISVPQKPCN